MNEWACFRLEAMDRTPACLTYGHYAMPWSRVGIPNPRLFFGLKGFQTKGTVWLALDGLGTDFSVLG